MVLIEDGHNFNLALLNGNVPQCSPRCACPPEVLPSGRRSEASGRDKGEVETLCATSVKDRWRQEPSLELDRALLHVLHDHGSHRHLVMAQAVHLQGDEITFVDVEVNRPHFSFSVASGKSGPHTGRLDLGRVTPLMTVTLISSRMASGADRPRTLPEHPWYSGETCP